MVLKCRSAHVVRRGIVDRQANLVAHTFRASPLTETHKQRGVTLPKMFAKADRA